MAERVIVSPGVFSREIDQTIRPADTRGAGLALVGPRAKGPAFEPVIIKDLDEDMQMFGPPGKDGKDYSAYTARAYLKQAAVPTTNIRVLGLSDTGVVCGFSVGGVYALGASGTNVVALIHSSGAVSLEGTLTSSVSELAINIAGYGSVTASLNRSDSKYLTKVLNTDPSQYSTKKHYVYAIYDYCNKTPIDNNFFVSEVDSSAGTLTDQYITGATTTVISQQFGSTEYDLFGVCSRFAGDSANTEVKVSVRDIRKSPNPTQYEYGSFTLVVREFADNDKAPRVLETFSNLSLDPSSRNYFCRRIGTRYRSWNASTKKFDEFGDYANKSKYIYVDPSTDLENGNVPATALPYGFGGYRLPASGCVGDKAGFPALPYVSGALYKNEFSTKVYWGVEITNNMSGAANYGVSDKLKHLAASLLLGSGTTDTTFSLRHLSGATANVSGYSTTARLTDAGLSALSTSIHYDDNSSGNLTLDNIENTSLAKFTFPISNGFDGVDIHKSNPFDPENMTTVTAYETHAYRTAMDMLANADEIEINEVVAPGVHASKVVDYTLEMVEDRGDCLYLMDVSGATVEAVTSDVTSKQLDSSYAACWYPWVRIYDEVNDKFVFVPPTTMMPAVIAKSDLTAFHWSAPAGLARGGLGQFGVVEAKDKLNKADRDSLYENRVNPISTTTTDGVVVWGQKTLQIAASALDRINVRRLLLKLRKVISREATRVVFEPNVPSTWGKFVSRVQPYLERVKQNSGLDDFKLILDERTTTEDLIERNIMYAKIAIKPSRTSEYVLLDFFITNNAAGFEE